MSILAVVFALAVSLFAVSRLYTRDDPNPVISLPAAPKVTAGEMPDTIERAEINKENVVAVISTLKRERDYYQRLTMRLYSTTGFSETVFELWVSGDNFRLKDYREGKATGNTLVIGLDMWRWYDDAEGYVFGDLEATPFRKADSFLGMPIYEEVLALPVDDIIDAGVSTERYRDPCIFVEYRAGQFGYRSRVYISQTNGLLVSSETYDKDMIIYSINSDYFTAGPQNEEVFEPPV